MFEITPKEQLLKNVRKGLVQPLPNKYPLLNSEKLLVKEPLLKPDEDFVKNWTSHGFHFAVYNGFHNLCALLLQFQETYQLGIPATRDQGLLKALEENEIPFLKPEQMQSTLCCSFSKLESGTETLYFSSELQPIRQMSEATHLILFGKASQVESPDSNRYFCDLNIKNDVRVQLPYAYFSRFRHVILLIEE